MFFSSKKSILGVDIGTNNIKIAQVTTKENVHTLDTYGIVNVSFEIDEGRDQIINQTVNVLKNLIDKAGVSTRKVVASMPNSAVFTTVLEMPKMSEAELKSAVEYEAKKYVPLPMNEITLTFATIEKHPDGKTTVLITAVPNSILRSYELIFQMAKLETFAIDIEAMALIRSVVGDDKGNNLIVDIGAKSTHLNITEAGNLVLARSVPIGGETITNKISEALKISYVRAEQFKKDFGINQASLIPETIKPILLALKTEVRQLQTIYQARGKKFDKILLTGGGANLPGLTDFFNDLGTKVTLGDPLSRLNYNQELKPFLSQYSGSLAVAIGLALRVNK